MSKSTNQSSACAKETKKLKNSGEKNSGSKRTRNFATVVYPESAPSDWQDLLAAQFIPTFISPLHDKDKNPTGEDKKEHYHVIIMFDSVKTTEQATQIFNLIGGVGCETVNSLRGYARYLCHLDNPEKERYSTDEVRALSGADYFSIIGLPVDRYAIIGEMMDYIDLHNIYDVRTLMRYARMERPDWYRSLCDNSMLVIKEYLRSAYWADHTDLMSEKMGL